MMPSKEAMAAAFVDWHPGTNGTAVITIGGAVAGTVSDWQAEERCMNINALIQDRIDRHTADLQREVEALRARVVLLEDISADGEGLACMVQGYSTLPTRVLREAEIVLQNIKAVRTASE